MSFFTFQFDFLAPLMVAGIEAISLGIKAIVQRARPQRLLLRSKREASGLVTAHRPRKVRTITPRRTKPKGFRARVKFALKKKSKPAKAAKARCTACDNEVKSSKMVYGACEHPYCRACVREIARLSFKDRALFPLRCCGQAFPIQNVVPVLDPTDRRFYFYRASEHATPVTKRWYCPSVKCGKFIAPRYIKAEEKVQKCPHCRTRICSVCRDLHHRGQECTPDSALREVLDLARRRHWQRCYNCHAMVELNVGCNHMTCVVCKAEFCYLCGWRWKTCACTTR